MVGRRIYRLALAALSIVVAASLIAGARATHVAAGGDAVGTYSSAIVYAGQVHDFYVDSTTDTLQHAWFSNGWHSETLDGAGAVGGNGRTSDEVGQYNSAVVYNGQLHDFYLDSTANVLRHAVWTGNRWFFEALDGSGVSGGNGRTSDSVGYNNAAVIYNGQVQDFYTDSTTNVLRHAAYAGGWFFEALDGPGVGGGNGRTSDFVGSYNSAVVYNGQLQDFYYDSTSDRLRHAAYAGGWFFEALDGSGVSGGNGRTPDGVGSYNAAIIYNSQVHDFYFDFAANTLRDAVWSGGGWFFEVLDGAGGSNGQTTDNVGDYNSAVIYNGQLQIFSYDFSVGNLRHSWYSNVWRAEALDGTGVCAGNGCFSSDSVGNYNSAIIYNGLPQDFYYDGTNPQLRHAVWNGSAWFSESPVG
ncbi:MAG: hypothetical protein JOY80_06390 [Candidatus Dormibacteraeota bacterium]|nr:hypothetical protein [Candidatus Dormibacteraeota bacterium]